MCFASTDLFKGMDGLLSPVARHATSQALQPRGSASSPSHSRASAPPACTHGAAGPHARAHWSPTLWAGGMGSGPIGFLTMVKNLMGQVPCPHSQGLGVQPVPQSAPPPRTRTHARRRSPHAHDHQSPTLCAGGMGSGPIADGPGPMPSLPGARRPARPAVALPAPPRARIAQAPTHAPYCPSGVEEGVFLGTTTTADLGTTTACRAPCQSSGCACRAAVGRTHSVPGAVCVGAGVSCR